MTIIIQKYCSLYFPHTQGFIAQCDKIEAGISDHLAKIQTKNLALAE